MRILILTPWQPQATGNHVTALRHKVSLQERGHEVAILEVRLDDADKVEKELRSFRPHVAHLLHAWRSGLPWLSCSSASSTPFVVTLTGTDIHEGINDPKEAPVIERILTRAARVITQNRLTKDSLGFARPDLTPRLRFLPPGIFLGEHPCALRQKYALDAKFLFFHPASIRPVKANLELLQLFDAMPSDAPAFHVAFCGPILDQEYGFRFLEAVRQRSWATYLGVIPPESMPAALREADVVLNHSLSEGLPNALLEATALGKAILARDIPGNRAIVEPGQNGILYAYPSEFIDQALRLLKEEKWRERLSRPQPERFDIQEEAAQLEALYAESVGELREHRVKSEAF